MTEESATTVKQELFNQAVGLPAEKRKTFLEEACGGNVGLREEVEGLLSAHERAGKFLSNSEIGQLPTERFGIGAKIGAYTLRKVIGEGGYGTVYLADQEAPLRRQVALKVVKAGMDTKQIVARFELERQALAVMDHVNIARVLDAGATESGRPYFVMEYVEGVSLTDFARERRLFLRERLALFLDVCAAVKHAHEKGVIHRDIKPANVLVAVKEGRAVVKVIDFGIAKALRTEDVEWRATLTQVPQMLGTPQYMSPEQAALPGGDIDSRTDVYSLGVLLYELLTGGQPYDLRALRAVGAVEWSRILREVDAVVPSAALLKLSETLEAGSRVHGREVREFAKEVRGDLDWITMKAMEKDRVGRYESVEAMAADIGRYLADEPVVAGPPRRGYRVRKYLRRHRQGLRMAVLCLIATGVGVVSALLWNRGRGDEGRVAMSLPATGPVRLALAVPATRPTTLAMTTPAADVNAGLAPGLEARFYSGADFETLVTERVDRQIDWSWTHAEPPVVGQTWPKYSVRWEGWLVVPAGGMEELDVNADDGAIVWIDGKEAIDLLRKGERVYVEKVAAGRHALRVDYFNKIAGGFITMRWTLPGTGKEVVPWGAFYHSVEAATKPAGAGG